MATVVGVSKRCCTEIHFIEPGIKVNRAYHDNLLAQKLLHIHVAGWISSFNRTAHRARYTVAFLKRKVFDFFPSTLWPPSSPYLKPIDYSICSALQEKVY